MTKIHLWPQENQIKEQNIQTSVTVETGNKNFSLWYRLPIKYQDNLTDNCDPFVIATIFLAMSQGSDLIVHGQVSPSLLDNLEEFQAAWSSWKPKTYQKIIIKAEEEKEIESSIKNKRAITAFSGGVDSSFTAFSHTRGNHSRKNLNLQAGLMVHGFDISIRQKEVFDRALQKSEIMLSSLGLVTIPLATNFRQVIKLNWEDVFATGVASCLHMVKKGFSIGLIPSSYPYRDVNFLWGSNPFTDLLLSSNSYRIIHDGAEFTRLNKIEQMLTWQEFLGNLRVCWQGNQKDRNCGRCEKCVRNILNFRVLNQGLPPCFEKDVTNQQIWNLKVKGGSLDALETLMKEIELNQKIIKTEPWLIILKLAIIKNKLINSLNFAKDVIPLTWKSKLKQIMNINHNN
jgi:hypothetical protein